MNIEKSLEEYLNNYIGIGKAYRALQITKQKTQNIEYLVKLTLDIAKSENLFGFYEIALKELKMNSPLEDHQEWFKNASEKYQEQIQNIKKDINQYKSQTNNQSTRLSMIELGRYYFKQGQVVEAYKQFDKANNYRQKEDTIIDFIDEYSIALLYSKEFEKLTILQTELQDTNYQQTEIKEKIAISQTCQLLRCIQQQNYTEFFEICQNRYQPDYLPENANILSTPQDLGNYITFLGFYKNKQANDKNYFTLFHNLYNNENVSPLIVSGEYSTKAAEHYISMQFAQAVVQVQQMVETDLNFDPFIQDKQWKLNDITKQFLIYYLKPFNKIKISNICKEFNIPQAALLEKLENMIKESKKAPQNSQNYFNFLIDPISGELVEKISKKQYDNKTYKQAVKTAQTYLHDKQMNLLQYRLSNIMRDSKDQFMMEEFGGDEMIKKQLMGLQR
ncbi:hypothetical protein PPERSA_11488 [Pseudocohnilembus persalinus]|uniref:26S proteasome regulatory subunit Rpn7 N-terminal domain-containing protein n=1 Tax=Pseudocohnilembus persalinus TaxID=266149 RepID=A0A0V0QX76_PSEPJ|nr:hypothetical protein PPERSA_11488 [Pseudocohnilembus persalinus]|eukprot:KRX06843.1 hypothetical protein PPERSA_11488 [Pseudocohnilembus persalinus]